MRVRCFLAVTAGVVFACSSAHALQYERVQLDAPSVVINARGPIIAGDAQRLMTFMQSLASTDRVIGFAVDSPGGSLMEAGQIADFINKSALSVVVPSEAQCASACFLLLAASPHRFAGADALIGVHGASDDGKDDVGSMAATTAVARALGQYRIPPAIIGMMVQTTPSRIEWLTPRDLQSMGVTVLADQPAQTPESPEAMLVPPKPSVIQPQPAITVPSPTPSPPAATPPPPATPEDWASYGEWIQAASRDTEGDAAQLADDINKYVGHTVVFESETPGWFVVALGPYPRGKADAERERLTSSGVIPPDSMVRTGAHFGALVWGDHPNDETANGSDGGVDTPRGDLTGGASALALRATRDFFRESSAPGSQLMNYLDSIYPATVTYFGKAMTKSDVLADKETFVERWPERLYTIDPNNLSASCTSDGKCTATGTVALRAHSPERQRTSVLTAKFALTFDTSGAPALVAETSEVVRRSIYKGQ
jgi:hypothetical protein